MDSMDSMYDVLLQLPLFQGVSRAKISELIEKTKFHFLKYKSGEQIVSKGEECTHLKFLISGCVRSEMVNKSGKIRVSEVLCAPNVLSPNHLFGRNTNYPSDLYAVEETGIMQIDKQTFIRIMQDESIILINLLNIISRRSQKCRNISRTFFRKCKRTLGILGTLLYTAQVDRRKGNMQTKRFVHIFRSTTFCFYECTKRIERRRHHRLLDS